MQSFSIESEDKVQVQAYLWPAEKPVAVLQITHGMMEHARRYDHFARWMNDHHIAVYANDHIGHGLNAKTAAELCHFPRKDDWQRSVDIMHLLTKRIHSDHPGLPLFILGHSMGSVLVQTYMINYGRQATAYILSGLINQPKLMAQLGLILSWMLSGMFGHDHRSDLLISLGYGQYKKKFKPVSTDFDWLSSDPLCVDEYVSSPLCGIPLTNRFYQNLFHGFEYVSRRNNLKKITAGTPVYVFAGSMDPAGNSGKIPVKICGLLKNIAKAKVDLKLYPGGRHEMLNEVNREEVYKDLLNWMKPFTLSIEQ
jgi:alpha-beta hydrolase superfamily lysophospholipase